MKHAVLSVEEIWVRLSQVSRLEIDTRPIDGTNGWAASGTGRLEISGNSRDQLDITESGHWAQTAGPGIRFWNCYRWQLDPDRGIAIAHLRYGNESPVDLVKLVPQPGGTWLSESPHICEQDCYQATLSMELGGIKLQWTIEGPGKNQEVRSLYY